MMAIPKRVQDRIKSGLRTFRKILEDARHADRSEQDTVTIVTDMLADIFGYDKYAELTGEYAIRGTYCDLAVRLDGKVKYLIEVKAIDKALNVSHIRQATDYAAKEGIEWVALTNGIEWQAYRMIFEQPVRFEHVFTMDLMHGGAELADMIYMLSREGITKSILDDYHEQRQVLNRYVVSAVLLSGSILKAIRRELRKISPPGQRVIGRPLTRWPTGMSSIPTKRRSWSTGAWASLGRVSRTSRIRIHAGPPFECSSASTGKPSKPSSPGFAATPKPFAS